MLGWADPATHHTTSGAWPLFHAIASAITRSLPLSSVTSALIYWNRWEEGFNAAACGREFYTLFSSGKILP